MPVLLVAACTDGGAADVSRAKTTPTGPVYIESIEPGSGTIGTELIIRGFGFDSEDNDIGFGGPGFVGRYEVAYYNYVASPDGKTLRLEMPDSLGACAMSQLQPGSLCSSSGINVPIGDLMVSVHNGHGTSNEVVFTREISRLEVANDEIWASTAYLKMWQSLNDAVARSSSVRIGAGVEQDEGGTIYIFVSIVGMSDSEIRQIVPDEIEGYEVRLTKHTARQY